MTLRQVDAAMHAIVRSNHFDRIERVRDVAAAMSGEGGKHLADLQKAYDAFEAKHGR